MVTVVLFRLTGWVANIILTVGWNRCCLFHHMMMALLVFIMAVAWLKSRSFMMAIMMRVVIMAVAWLKGRSFMMTIMMLVVISIVAID